MKSICRELMFKSKLKLKIGKIICLISSGQNNGYQILKSTALIPTKTSKYQGA